MTDAKKARAMQTCASLLRTALGSARHIQTSLEKHSWNESLQLWEFLSVNEQCVSNFSRVMNPLLQSLLVTDPGFQSWILACAEMLRELERKIETCESYKTLEVELKGPRLRRSFDRVFEKIARHQKLVEDCLSHCDISITTDRESYVEQVRNALSLDGGLSRMGHLIEDEEGRFWWEANVGSKYAVPWEKFADKLRNHADVHITKIVSDEASMELFRKVLTGDMTCRAVKASQWADFLYSYGPGIRVALIQMVASEQSAPWFAGALTLEEAKCVLTPCTSGTFLIRFSESTSCTWAISYANDATGTVSHALVQAHSSELHPEEAHFECGQRRYKSFAEIIAAHGNVLRTPAPKVKNLGPARCFRDFLSFDETEAMLQGKPVGTFLFRFSRQHEGCLVVGYVSGGRIRQSRIYCDPSRGFVLDEKNGKVYRRISHLVRDNKALLAIPLAVDLDLFEGDLEEDDRDELVNYTRERDNVGLLQEQRYMALGHPGGYGSIPDEGMLNYINLDDAAATGGYGHLY